MLGIPCFGKRFPIGFVARGALPQGVFPEAATFSRWWAQGVARHAFGNFCRAVKVTRLGRNARKSFRMKKDSSLRSE
jgi:hypothetical protein